MNIDVIVYNLQNMQESILILVADAPPEWSTKISPTEFNMEPNSMLTITLSFSIPEEITPGEYSITLTARSQKTQNVQSTESINLLVKPDVIIEAVKFSKNDIRESDKVELTISVKNIGLAAAKDINIVVYDAMTYTTDHELARRTIPTLAPNSIKNIKINWHPQAGKFNITVWANPDSTLDELRNSNNFKIEDVTVGPAEETDSSNTIYFLLFLVLIILVIFWVIRRYKFNGDDDDRTEPQEPQKNNINLNRSKLNIPQRSQHKKPQDGFTPKRRPRR
jgi:uncharacterized membrane protein